jgi:hypothetical protein
MSQRLLISLLALTGVVCAQRRVDSKNSYDRVIAVVSFIGSGTQADPKRPQYVPWPPTRDPNGIIAWSVLPSDDGRFALIELVARNRSAFQSLLSDKTIAVFEKGRVTKAQIESALKQYRKDLSLDSFGTVMP